MMTQQLNHESSTDGWVFEMYKSAYAELKLITYTYTLTHTLTHTSIGVVFITKTQLKLMNQRVYIQGKGKVS